MTHLEFIVEEEKPKTKVYEVKTIHNRSILGKIYWYCRWRQYIFEPFADEVWSEDCLKELYEFLKKLKEDRRRK